MSLLDDASLIVTPNAEKAGKLYSIIPSNGNGDFSVTRATTATRVNASGLVENSPINEPRLDYSLGSCPNILLEPQRTNSIRNSTMVGASVPSTLPTNWVRQNTSGLTQTIVGVGTENGVNYVDINLQGIAISQNDAYSFDQTISASIGQTWTSSWYFKLVTSTPNAVRLAMQEFNGAVFLNVVTQDITPTTTLARYAQTKTLVGTGVTNVRSMIYVNFVIGQTYNTTIRLAAPQMEQGAYATSYIPTTSASVTRNLDVVQKTGVSSLIGQTEGTLYWEGTLIAGQADDIFFLNRNLTNSVFLYKTTANQIFLRIYYNSASIAFGSASGYTGNVKIAAAYKSGDTILYVNGVQVGTSATAFAFTAALSDVVLNNSTFFLGSQTKNVKTAALFPTRLTNTQLAALTA